MTRTSSKFAFDNELITALGYKHSLRLNISEMYKMQANVNKLKDKKKVK